MVKRKTESLFVMIGFVVKDGEGSVELLDKEKTNHLMIECHGGERQFVMGGGINPGGEAKGSAYNEGEITHGGVHLFLYIL